MSELPHGRDGSDDFWDVIYTQRAIRYWQDKPVPRDQVEKIIEAASRAPSGSNSQPWVFVVIDDAETRGKLGDALNAIYEGGPLKDMIAQGQQTEDKTQRLMMKGAKAFFSGLAKAPVIVIPCLYKLASPTPDPGSLEAGSSIYMAVQNLMLSARALGIGTVMTTAHALIEKDLRAATGIPDDAYPVALIPMGYPDANFGPTKRKPVSEILCWNEWHIVQ